MEWLLYGPGGANFQIGSRKIYVLDKISSL